MWWQPWEMMVGTKLVCGTAQLPALMPHLCMMTLRVADPLCLLTEGPGESHCLGLTHQGPTLPTLDLCHLQGSVRAKEAGGSVKC